MENASKPPSTIAIVPVTNLEASLIKYWIVPNNSSGVPRRLNGVCAMTDSARGV